MALPDPLADFVLIERAVRFGPEDVRKEEERKEEYAAAAAIGAGRWTSVAGASRPTLLGINPVMKPIPVLADPPRPSCLYMLLPADAPFHFRPSPAEIATTHKGILLLRTILNNYILYDVTTNELTAITALPGLRDPPISVPLGSYTAVLVGDDDYVLADIVAPYNEDLSDLALPQANVFTWSKSNAGGEWVQSPVSLPLPAAICGPEHHFHIDMTFSFEGRIFWVDLLQGILLCHLLDEGGPNLDFIPLPLGYTARVHRHRRHTLRVLCERSIACVSGVVKFAAFVGDSETFNGDVLLKTWALSPDFSHWTEDTKALSVSDIVASESFNQMGLPRAMPVCPVLSMTEDGIMYALLNVIDMEPLEQLNEFGQCLGNRLLPKANYIIRFDIRRNKILSYTTPSKDAQLRWMQPTLLGTDFSAYLARELRTKQQVQVEVLEHLLTSL
uniref:DUF1618 domain-containing protein n=1 Tax=Leersia perrieri TaxID=77586 RepID=A0A0D9UW17_9ORYZ